MEIIISDGVTPESVTDAVDGLKQQMEYHWHSICEKVPTAKVKGSPIRHFLTRQGMPIP
ncbi:MAG: hypothetical protein OXB88_02270 [Bacteriovoracales bacterium]|nr:hypothetical protein [Bacteriovoracales bacterium]